MGKYDIEIKSVMYENTNSNTYDLMSCYRNIIYAYNQIDQHFSLFFNEKAIYDISYILNNPNFDDKKKVAKMREMIEDFSSISDYYSHIVQQNKIIAYNAFCMLSLIYTKNQEEILDEIYKLYLKKNTEYSDNWCKNGINGIFWDLNRKISRLKSIIANYKINSPDVKLFDTLQDLYLYAVFFIVYVTENRIKING